MTLSFIIVNLNTRRLLLDCIGSIYKTSGPMEFEIFLVDNGSTDGSVEAVREAYPAVDITESPVNMGFARANNLALKKAKGQYMVLVNSDAVLTEGALSTIVAYMDAHPEAGVCGAQLLNADGSLQNSIAPSPDLLTELTNKSLLRRIAPRRYMGKETRFDQPMEVDTIVGAFMVIRASAMREVGLMDEDFFFFLEETEWCLRFRRAGHKVIHHPGARVFHYQGQSAGQRRVRARLEYWRSRYIFFAKTRGQMANLLLRAGLLARLAVDLGFWLVYNCLTIGVTQKGRDKLSLYWTLMLWHLRGCPTGPEWGLRPSGL